MQSSKRQRMAGSRLWASVTIAAALLVAPGLWAGCAETESPASAPAPRAPEVRSAATLPASPPAVRNALAMAGGHGEPERGVALDIDEDELQQAPESYSLRGRALGEGHDQPEPDIRTVAAAPKDNDGGKDGEKGEDEEDNKDYWAEVPFDRSNFDEVRSFVRLHYIDDHINEKRAFIEAANFALLSLQGQPLEILPESFYKLRKGHPDEEGRLAGKTWKLNRSDRHIVHEIPKDLDKKRRRLSDDEIRQLRLRDKARHALLERHWKKVPFGETEFSALLADAVKRTKKDEEVDPNDIFIAAAQGYLYSLDPHSALVSAKAWEESTRQTEDASFDGIGAVLTQRDDETIVESPIQGQPAIQAGLRAGDVILEVDGKDIGGLPLFKVVQKIRGPRGTNVTLTVRRMGVPEDFPVTITRAHIAIKNVEGRLLELGDYQDIGYIKMTGFVRSSAAKFDEMLASLTAQTKSGTLRGLIFDLRNDNGGLLAQGIAVADRFLTDGVIVSVRNKASALGGLGGARDEVYRATPEIKVTCPVVVLVNDGTASAAEIVASALQENKRALVVGDRTFGKASVQTLYPPPGQKDYYIKLTVARYYSPTQRTIQLTGVTPDVSVPPVFGEDMPLGFREENLRNPLPPEDSHYRSPMADWLPALSRCAKDGGQAEKLHASDPNPAIKFDFQLYHGADYLECLIRETMSGATQN